MSVTRDGRTGLDQDRTKPNLYPEAEPHLKFCFKFEKEGCFSHILLPFALFISNKTCPLLHFSCPSHFPRVYPPPARALLRHSDMEMAGTLRTACWVCLKLNKMFIFAHGQLNELYMDKKYQSKNKGSVVSKSININTWSHCRNTECNNSNIKISSTC